MQKNFKEALERFNTLVTGDADKELTELDKIVSEIVAGNFREKGNGLMGDLYRSLTDTSQETINRTAWAQVLDLTVELINAGQKRAAYILSSGFPDTIPSQEADTVAAVCAEIRDDYFKAEVFAAAARGHDAQVQKLAIEAGMSDEDRDALCAEGKSSARKNRRASIVILSVATVLCLAGTTYGVVSLYNSIRNPSIPSVEQTVRGFQDSGRSLGNAASDVTTVFAAKIYSGSGQEDDALAEIPLLVTPVLPITSEVAQAVGVETSDAISSVKVGETPSQDSKPAGEKMDDRRVMACTLGMLAIDRVSMTTNSLTVGEQKAANSFEARYDVLCGDFRSRSDIWSSVVPSISEDNLEDFLRGMLTQR